MAFKMHHQVTIYTNGSVMSGLAKDYFRTAGIDFDETNVLTDKAAMLGLREIGVGEDTELPVVDFDGRVIAGYQPDVYAVILKESDARDAEREKKNA